jgi:hypothetical protein
VGPRTGLNKFGGENLFPAPEFEPRNVHHVASRCTEYAIPASSVNNNTDCNALAVQDIMQSISRNFTVFKQKKKSGVTQALILNLKINEPILSSRHW